MAIYRDKEIQCEKCKTIYESKFPSFIRVPADNDIKNEFVSGEFHFHKCPNCLHNNFSPSPSLYIDDEKKIAIINNNYDEAIGDRIELKEEFSDYKFYISESVWITPDIINAIDNGFDPFVLEFIKHDGSKYFESKRKNCQVYNSYIKYSDDGYQINLVVLFYDANNDTGEYSMIIEPKLYNNYVDKVERFKAGADESVISSKYVRKLYHLARNLGIDEAKQNTYEFLQCRDEYDDAVLAFVQNFNEAKFKKGEIIGLVDYDKKDNCKVSICYVDKIIHMTDYEYYSEINDLPVATYKATDKKLEAKLDSETELHNDVLKEELKNNFKDDNYDVLFNAMVRVPMKLDEECLNKAVNIDYEDENKAYFPLYLDPSDINNESVDSKLNVIVSFKAALRLFFNVANRYDGIIINPDTDKFKLSLNQLFRFITNRIMTNHNLMKEFLDNASNEEIAFIGEDKYNLIKKVYSTEIGLKAIREELNLTKEKADYMLDDGYARIKRIIKSKQLM